MNAKISEKIHVGPQWGEGGPKMVENPSTWFMDAALQKNKVSIDSIHETLILERL